MFFSNKTTKISLLVVFLLVGTLSYSSWEYQKEYGFTDSSLSSEESVENAIDRLKLRNGYFLLCGALINKNHRKPVYIAPKSYNSIPIPLYKNDLACLVRDMRKVIIHDDRFFKSDQKIKEDLDLLIKHGVIGKISYYLPEGGITNTILFKPEAKKDALILAIADLKKETNPYLFGLLLGYDEEDIAFFYQRSNYIDNPQEKYGERLEELFNSIPYIRWTESDHRIFEQYLKESNIDESIEKERKKAIDFIRQYTDVSTEKLNNEFHKLTQ